MLEEQLHKTPGDVEVLATLGDVALVIGDLQRAQKVYRALLLQKLDESAPISKAQVFAKLAEITLALGDPRKARNLAERALEADPKIADLPQLLARIEARGGGAVGIFASPGAGDGGASRLTDDSDRKKGTDVGVIFALVAIVALVTLGLILVL